MSLATVQARVNSLCNQLPEAVVSVADRLLAIADALREYSEARPRPFTLEVQPTPTTYEYSLTTVGAALSPAITWNDAQKVVRAVYPADQAYEQELDRRGWGVYQKPNRTWWIKFIWERPASGRPMWLYCTEPHTVDESTDTVLAQFPHDWDAFCNLCAYKILKAAAVFYADKSASTVKADVVNWQNKSSDYMRRATDCLEEYTRIVLNRAVARAGGRINWDIGMSGGSDMLFYRRRNT